MSEMVVMSFSVLICCQGSSMWSSILLVPLSISFIMTTSSSSFFSGLVILVYIMVFIGGLLVLLVSVSSISMQEQGYSVTKTLFIIFLIGMSGLAILKVEPFSPGFVSWMSWILQQSQIYFVVIITLLVGLLALSWFLSLFKGMVRSVFYNLI